MKQATIIKIMAKVILTRVKPFSVEFPFHNTFLKEEVWHKFSVGMHITYTLFNAFPMTLYRYVTEDAGSIWQLVDFLEKDFHNLTEIHPDHRRSLERTQFMEWFEKQSHLHWITKDAFTLEAAERAILYRREDRLWRIRTNANQQPLEVLVRGHELATVVHDVNELHQFDLTSSPSTKELTRLILTLEGRSIKYDRVDEPVFRTLLNLRDEELGVADVDGPVLEALKERGIFYEAT